MSSKGQRKITSVYVTGLPSDITAQELRDYFGKCGVILEDLSTGEPKIKIYREIPKEEAKQVASDIVGEPIASSESSDNPSNASMDESREVLPPCKGDALIIYFKEESVDLAIKILDDTDIRPDCKIHVQKAEFKSQPKVTSVDTQIKKRRMHKFKKKLEWF